MPLELLMSAGRTPQLAARAAAERFRGLRFHDIRHHFITKLSETGAPDSVILSIAGHVSKKMLEHYSHIRDLAKQKAVRSVESYCPGIKNGDTAEEVDSAKIL